MGTGLMPEEPLPALEDMSTGTSAPPKEVMSVGVLNI